MSSYQRALDIMTVTPVILTAITTSATTDLLDRRPSSEAWSIREVVEHLLHVESAVIVPRIRQMLQEDNPLLGAAPRPSASGDLSAAVEAWRKARAANLEFLRSLTPAQRERAGRHATYGRISVEEHVVEWAYHDLDHLRQILAAIQSEIYADIGAFQPLYPKPA